MTQATNEGEGQQDKPEGIELTMAGEDNSFEPEEADTQVEPADEGEGRS